MPWQNSNKDLLRADPRLEQVRIALDKGQDIMELGSGQRTSIQALPLKLGFYVEGRSGHQNSRRGNLIFTFASRARLTKFGYSLSLPGIH